ncbi:unnamed protein product [Ilex paraguariensis]|uniref:Uncharacterized protein n=1 Tax=Ilex paraguariensis TaxID=185542 RepID=A0ABC8R5A1_9AQUA
MNECLFSQWAKVTPIPKQWASSICQAINSISGLKKCVVTASMDPLPPPLFLHLLRPYSLNAIGLGNGPEPDPSTLINDFTRFCYQRDLLRAMTALHSMQNHKIWADSITYSELIKCCLACCAIEQGKLVHKHIFSDGYQPKTFLLNVLLNMSALIDNYLKWDD